MALDMHDIDALVCDLDGVVYRGDSVIPGAVEAIHRLKAAGVRTIYATNNAMQTVETFRAKLAAFGLPADADELVTSAVVTAEEIAQRGWTKRSAFVIGGDGIREALAHIGMNISTGEDARRAEIVVVANDPNFDFDALRTAGLALHEGAEFLATNNDPTYPVPDGLWPGAGSILAAVETVASRRAEVMGKPHAPMMQAIARRLEGCDRIVVVGDQPATDLDGARSMGWMTILVLSGVTEKAAANDLDPQPDLVIPSISALGL